MLEPSKIALLNYKYHKDFETKPLILKFFSIIQRQNQPLIRIFFILVLSLILAHNRQFVIVRAQCFKERLRVVNIT